MTEREKLIIQDFERRLKDMSWCHRISDCEAAWFYELLGDHLFQKECEITEEISAKIDENLLNNYN
jgi:hypothetical protein